MRTIQERQSRASGPTEITAIAASLALAAAAGAGLPDFDSGSDGSDGALEFPDAQPGDVIVLAPKSYDPPLDADNDGVFHFTTITIPESVTVRLRADVYGRLPAYWLASGDVVIDGTLNLGGLDGHSESAIDRSRSIPGPGGFSGGVGSIGGLRATAGAGPGGGPLNDDGAHATDNPLGTVPVPTYGNRFLLPLLGGSGGGGRDSSKAEPGGGAGGGAILLSSNTQIVLEGQIFAAGGDGGRPGARAGSGGSVRLAAPAVTGSGTVTVRGGRQSDTSPDVRGGSGWIRVETWQLGDNLRLEPYETVPSGGMNINIVPLSPRTPLLPSEIPTAVRVTSVDGQPVDIPAVGSLFVPDLVIDSPAPVEVGFEAEGIPPGTELEVELFSAEPGDSLFTTTPLVGTIDQSTATATIEFPPGLVQFFVTARWGDAGQRGEQPASADSDENGDRAEGEPSNPTDPAEPDQTSD